MSSFLNSNLKVAKLVNNLMYLVLFDLELGTKFEKKKFITRNVRSL